jgi:hypothetical protein
VNHDITLGQIKERLVPVLQNIGLVYKIDATGKDQERWNEIYEILYPLFLDISVSIDKQEAKPVKDTQFQGFAKLLVDELTSLELMYGGVAIDEASIMSRYYREAWETIIARGLYDFAKHTMSHVGQGMAAENEGGPKYLEENMRCIPDMTEWPKETKA